jgi:hypothetical protein
VPKLFAQDLLDTGDRLVDRLLGATPSGVMRWIAFGQTNLSTHEQSLGAGPVSRRGAHYAASWTGTHARMTRRLVAQAKLTKF